MEKKIALAYGGQLDQVGEFAVSRFLPNRYVRLVGPFFFLDHLRPTYLTPRPAKKPDGYHAHPHRGIATFSYLFEGALEHYDSRGHKGTVGAGGAQWMKAGNGIIHDENPTLELQEKGGNFHGLQFWINLPAKNKAENPGYLAVQPQDVPEIPLPDNAGLLRVLIGDYEGQQSPVETYSEQFNYHLKLAPGATFNFQVKPAYESAVFIPVGEVRVNGPQHGNGELLVFDLEGEEINLENTSTETVDVILFGGEPYTEPIASKGPFVMNTEDELLTAYRDAQNGKYGKLSYD